VNVKRTGRDNSVNNIASPQYIARGVYRRRGTFLFSLAAGAIFAGSLFTSPIPIAAQASPTPIPTEPISTPTLTPEPNISNMSIINQRDRISLANVQDVQEVLRWQAHTDQVTSVLFLPDANRLISTGANGTLRLRPIAMWEINNGQVSVQSDAFEDVAGSGYGSDIQMQLSSQSQFLTAASGIWYAPTGLAVAYIPQAYATSVAFLYDTTVVIGGENGVVGVWSFSMPTEYYDTGELPENFTFAPNQSVLLTAFRLEEAITQVLYDPTTTQIFILSEGGSLYRYLLIRDDFGNLNFNLVSAEQNTTLTEQGIGSGILAALQPGTPRIAYATSSVEVQIYDFQNNQPLSQYTVQQEIGCIAYSPDGSLLILGDRINNGVLHILDTEANNLLAEMPTGQPVTSCAFSIDGSLIATGHDDGSILLWGIE